MDIIYTWTVFPKIIDIFQITKINNGISIIWFKV